MIRKRRFSKLWYVKKRNLKYYRMLLGANLVILIFVLLWMYTCLKLFPLGLIKYENEIYESIQVTVKNELGKATVINADYGNIIEIEKDIEGRIVSAKADNLKLTKLSFSLEQQLKDMLIREQESQFTPLKAPLVPLGWIQIHLGGAKVTDVKTEYTTRFVKEDETGTRLRIYMNISVTYEYLLGEKSKTYEFILLDALLENQ